MDMYDRLRSDEYKNQLTYPTKPKKPLLDRNATSVEAKHYAEVLEQWEKDMDVYREEVKEYRKEENRLYEQIKKDCLEDVGLLNHPKADKAWEWAWEHGHSSGYSEVYQVLCGITDLVL